MGELKGNDAFDKTFIQAPLEFAKNMDVALDKVDKFIELMKKSESAIGIAKSTKKVREENNNLLESQKELQKIEKQISTARGKLIASRSKEAKQLAELKVQTTERNKKLREEAKAARGLIGAFDKLNKERTEAKKLLRDLVAGQKASNEELEKAQKAFDKLDDRVKEANKSVKDGSLDVGRYEDEIRAATEGNEAFSGSSTQVLQNFISISQQEGGIKSFFKSFVSGITAVTKAALKFILTPLGLVITAIVAGIAAFTAIISRNQAAADKFNEIWKAGTAILDVVIDRILKLFTAFGKLLSGDFKGAANDVADAFSNIGDSIAEAGRRGVAIARLTAQVERLNTSLKLTESALEGQIRKFEILSDDATRSFKERENAANEARKLNILLAQERENVARKELELTNEQIKQAIASGKINRVLRDQQAEAIANLVRAESEALAVELENEKTRRELKQDRLERDLDILIDGFDNIKTINDRIIEDEDRVLNKRIDTFNTLTELSDKSFNKQIETIKKFTKVAFDENELLAEQDAVILNEKIRQLGLSEIIEGRLLEIVRERRIVLSEAADLEKELTKAIIDQNAIRELDSKSLETTITDNQLKALDERIKNHKNANETLNENDLERQELINASIDTTSQLFSDFTQLRIQQISQQLEATEFARNRELEQVAGNKRAEFEINKQFDNQRKQLERDQLNATKVKALFDIAIATAVNIAKAGGRPILTALAIAAGASQTALVLAQQVPQFDKGIESTPKDYIAGEKRPELRKSGGKWGLVKEPTMFKGSPGDTIISGKETDSILGSMADLTGKNMLTDPGLMLGLMNNDFEKKKATVDLAYVIKKTGEDTVRAINKKKFVDIQVNTSRPWVAEINGQTRIEHINQYYRS